MPDGEFDMYPIRKELDRQELAQLKREAHQLRVDRNRLHKQAVWYRRQLARYTGTTTLRIWEGERPDLFPGIQDHLDKMA